MSTRYAAKRELLLDTLTQQLPELEISGVSAGLHVLASLPLGVDEQRAALRARDAGVGVHDLHRHFTTVAHRPPAFNVGFALPTESELRQGAQLLAEAIRNDKRPQASTRRRLVPAR